MTSRRENYISNHQEPLSSYDLNLRLIKKILTKFPKKDLYDLWEDHSDFCRYLPNFSTDRRRSDVVSDLFNVVVNYSLKTKPVEDLVAKFDLLNVSLNSEKRTWKAFELKNQGRIVSDRKKFQTLLTGQLKRLKIKCHTSTCFRKECIWLRLFLQQEDVSVLVSPAMYIQYEPYLSYIFISGSRLSSKNVNLVFQALKKVFDCTEVEQLLLKSQHVGSIIHMIYAKDSHTFSNTENMPALLQSQLRKRTAIEDNVPEVVDQDLDKENKKRKYIEKTFGMFEPPKLETITLLADTKPFGVSKKMKIDENIKTAVIFKGSDTLAGLSRFVVDGIVKRELPTYLENIVVSGSDTMYVNS